MTFNPNDGLHLVLLLTAALAAAAVVVFFAVDNADDLGTINMRDRQRQRDLQDEARRRQWNVR